MGSHGGQDMSPARKTSLVNSLPLYLSLVLSSLTPWPFPLFVFCFPAEIAKQMKPLYWVMKESEKETSEGNGGGNGDGDEISPTKSPQDPSANPLPHFPDDVAPSHLPEMEMEPPQEKETEERRGESSLQENLPSQETSEIMGSNVGDKKVPLPEEEQSEKMEEGEGVD